MQCERNKIVKSLRLHQDVTTTNDNDDDHFREIPRVKEIKARKMPSFIVAWEKERPRSECRTQHT